MIELASKVLAALDEIKNASITDPQKAMRTYNILLYGERNNVISSNDLLQTLNNQFSVDIDKEKFSRLLSVLSELNKITCEPLTITYNPDLPASDIYLITLYS
ncbi:hypothetical protein ERICIV_02176 [Paenibacillus larvae subsp. larvae]|uniref:Uncharacterized protein n=4 Tax=root TaxID=1 RepID=A0A345AVM1_9CAUD|nr:hypothetical protein [Paenibacillus larvae]YP_010082290.1 hypothetical protein KMD18_gp36 [Paenibacillus phage Halcyone]YP_010082381.1 hypothetical protein KMD19_gp37 [Paenibacillus phage Scottie]AXF41045.1 hypothetical protein HEATH_36 [Paenibacillus phage Heath]AQZ48328.1 hypothetical protein B5S25_18815 [Paenibacillus larvae subsp. pulvifaciens]AVF26316.1 hypothetical protein ERICIII_02155 [Paenibacillus larvae subsp. larvae]AVF31093.1 hypothetical protein ERICIV_02176 [Paenibacillus la